MKKKFLIGLIFGIFISSACFISFISIDSPLRTSIFTKVGITSSLEERPFGNRPMNENQSQNNVELEENPLDVVYAKDINTSKDLVQGDIETIIVNDSNNIEIDKSGSYLITGTSNNGSIKIEDNVKNVVLILKDLDLTSINSSTLNIGKNSQVKIIVEGSVTLTDNEDISNDGLEDFDGCAIKIKDGADVYLTGSGDLNIYGNTKNGIKSGNNSLTSFVIDGDLNLNIFASNDAINSGYDLFIYNGNITINAGDDAIHSDRILTIGKEDSKELNITIESCNEGFEGSIVNFINGNTTISSTDDAVNAANSDGLYKDEFTYAINILGGNHTINAGVDGLDSNGDINIVGGFTIINAKQAGGDAGIDYDNKCYINEDVVENNAGISGPDNLMFGGMKNGNGMGNGTFDKDFNPDGQNMNFDGKNPSDFNGENFENVPERKDIQNNQ